MRFTLKEITNVLQHDNNDYYDISNLTPTILASYQYEGKWCNLIGYKWAQVLYVSDYEVVIDIQDTGARYEIHFIRKNKI